MKKRIFLMLAIVAVLVCALAITVGAQEIKRFETDELQSGENITYLEGINEDMYLSDTGRNNSFYELLDPDFMARAVLKNSDGTYTTYPAWYFITYIQYLNGAEYSYTTDRINAMSDITGETYSTSSIIRFEFPEYKAGHGFSIKSYGSYGFVNAKYVRVPSHATSISFRNAQNLVEIEYAPGTVITSVSDKAFVDCHSLEIVRMPNSATSMGSEIVCFWSTNGSTAALKEIYLGASMASMGTKNPLNTANVNGLKIYVPETIDGATYSFSTHFPAKSMLIFTGTKAQAEAFGALKTISYEEYKESGFAHEAGTIVYGYSACDAFYDGQHVEKTQDTNPCVLVDCENCRVQNLYVGNDSTHILASTTVYARYDMAGEDVIYCTNAGCIHRVATEAPALFKCLGYSVQSFGKGGVALAYSVNGEAIEEYTLKTGNSLKYGVFAVLKDKLGDNDVFSADGTVADGVINAEVSGYALSVFEIKVTGFSDEQKDIKLAIGAYVEIENECAKEYSYMQFGTPNDGEKYSFVSYNDIA